MKPSHKITIRAVAVFGLCSAVVGIACLWYLAPRNPDVARSAELAKSWTPGHTVVYLTMALTVLGINVVLLISGFRLWCLSPKAALAFSRVLKMAFLAFWIIIASWLVPVLGGFVSAVTGLTLGGLVIPALTLSAFWVPAVLRRCELMPQRL
jgi:hypothetical protein